jgi:phage baseplate assembly protein W
MLSIKDRLGIDITYGPPAPVVLQTSEPTAPVSVICTISESDPALPFKVVQGIVDWNDGSLPAPFSSSNGLLTISTSRNLLPGTYAITVTGLNNRVPVPDVVKTTLRVSVVSLNLSGEPVNHIFGPILPKDDGFPNKDQWVFNLGSDLEILASSIKMLLITAKGERLMNPDYGTDLRRIIFELNVGAIESIIQQEIVNALNTFEPRASIRSIAVDRTTNSRAVSVQATFLSKLSSQPFDINLQFER